MRRSAKELPEMHGEHEDVTFFELMNGHLPRNFARLMRRLPSDPRCRLCNAPFGGMGGRMMRRVGFGPSRKNPTLCNTCFEKAPIGGVVMALYIPLMLDDGWEAEMVRDGRELLEAVGYGSNGQPWLRLGVGLD